MEKLKKSIDTIDHENIRILSHKMKGSSANLGAKEFSELCGKMEEKVKINELKIQLRQSFAKTMKEFKNYLTGLNRKINI
ncbi:MAG: Hpt domain-containing protein [Candidatus Cloacimonadales bacterium]|nr:Hpt domain-containing protein [Candidatus Cloacimonadales bacterium]